MVCRWLASLSFCPSTLTETKCNAHTHTLWLRGVGKSSCSASPISFRHDLPYRTGIERDFDTSTLDQRTYIKSWGIVGNIRFCWDSGYPGVPGCLKLQLKTCVEDRQGIGTGTMARNQRIFHPIIVGMNHHIASSQIIFPKKPCAEYCEKITFKNNRLSLGHIDLCQYLIGQLFRKELYLSASIVNKDCTYSSCGHSSLRLMWSISEDEPCRGAFHTQTSWGLKLEKLVELGERWHKLLRHTPISRFIGVLRHWRQATPGHSAEDLARSKLHFPTQPQRVLFGYSAGADEAWDGFL